MNPFAALPLDRMDWIAVAWLFGLWIAYATLSNWRSRYVPSLHNVMNRYRRRWMARSLVRENKIVDSAILQSLFQGSTFFASTSILILGGLIATLGATDQAADVVGSIPYARRVSRELVEVKLLVMVAIFVYAFFKFTWSMRQFNIVSVLVGTTPTTDIGREKFERWIDNAATLTSLAGENFNDGMRAYYFAMAGLTWFMGPWLMMVATVWVVGVLYFREFKSPTLQALVEEERDLEPVTAKAP